MLPDETPAAGDRWWNGAVVYQVYLRSFADADGDGIGDLRGLTSRLDYLAHLGVDAIWLNPCYASPQRDHGYDISDYFAIDPDYGTLEDFDAMVVAATARGIKVVMDMVANHCSSEHEWFRSALAAAPGSPQRARFHFADGRGHAGELPPTNYQSVFGGDAWSRIADVDGAPGQWYLHFFDSAQPDFNWSNPDVVAYFDEVVRFWFNRGVAGFRVDVAHGMAKSAELFDVADGAPDHPAWDQPEVHDIIRRWRAIGDANPTGAGYWVGEIWVSEDALARYLRPDEFHQAFSFDLLVQPWHAPALRAAIERSIALAGARSWPAWALSNHDVHRLATRYGQDVSLEPADPADLIGSARRRGAVNVELGIRRARAAALLQFALPGTVFVYQGEELGLPEVLDLPPEVRQDPIFTRSSGTEYGRDGCRVPIPWRNDSPSFGFSEGASPAPPWLPQPAEFSRYCAEVLRREETSVFATYADAVRARRRYFADDAALDWLDSPEGTLAFRRGSTACVVNTSDRDVAMPVSGSLLLASVPMLAGVLAANSAAYLALEDGVAD